VSYPYYPYYSVGLKTADHRRPPQITAGHIVLDGDSA